jgi:hypothetical protein
MATELEIRHEERERLFDLLRAKELNDIDYIIVKLKSKMEKEDVEVVKQQFNEWKEGQKT